MDIIERRPGRGGGALAVLIAAAMAGCGGAEPSTAAPTGDAPAARTPWPVSVVVPPDLGQVPSGLVDATGRAIGVPCETCHDQHGRPGMATRASELKDFHLDLRFAHGDQGCFACHDTADRSRLHLADGEAIPLADAMRLCTQCHGPQARDWRNGSHGGMQGYWDRGRGPRTRASCMSCHDAHAPAWAQVVPVFKPRDRFLEDRGAAHGSADPDAPAPQAAPADDITR